MNDAFFLMILALLIALLLDLFLGEPRRWHPLVGFGYLAYGLERWLNRQPADARSVARNRALLCGFFAWFFLVIVLTIILMIAVLYLKKITGLNVIIDAVILYFAIGFSSLKQHAQAVIVPLNENNIASAREAVGMIVSRDVAEMDEMSVRKATIESVLENGSDAVFAPVFWFMMGGVPAVILYRLSNTLDAMWGYKTPRFVFFGRCAARMDDILNYLPSRLVALSYSLLGNTRAALNCWFEQANKLESPNAGPVMTAGAGALGLRLGGVSVYNGEIKNKPVFGCGAEPITGDIERSVKLVENTLFCWCMSIGFAGLASYLYVL